MQEAFFKYHFMFDRPEVQGRSNENEVLIEKNQQAKQFDNFWSCLFFDDDASSRLNGIPS